MSWSSEPAECESACSLVSLSRPVALPFVPVSELFFNSHSSRKTSLEVFSRLAPRKQQQEIRETIPDTIFSCTEVSLPRSFAISRNLSRAAWRFSTISWAMMSGTIYGKRLLTPLFLLTAVGISCAEGVGDRIGQGMGRSAENRLDLGVKAGRLG